MKKTKNLDNKASYAGGGNFTKGRTDWLCKELGKHGVTENVFKEIKKRFEVEVGFNSVGSGGRYSLMKEKLEKEEKESGELSKEDVYLKVLGKKYDKFRRVLPEMFKKKKEEYEKAVEILNQYCSLHKESIDEEHEFLINYMYGMIYVHLQDYKKAVISFTQSQEILEKAGKREEEQKKDVESTEKKEEGWTKGLLGEKLRGDFKKRITKSVLKSEFQKSEEIESIEHLLAEKTLVHGRFKKDLTREKVERLVKGMKTCEFNEKILEYLGCSMLEERSRTNVIITEQEISFDRDVRGYYNNKNTVRIISPNYKDTKGGLPFSLIYEKMNMEEDARVQDTMLHEIIHWAMNRLFNNHSRPYKRGDTEAIKAHNNAIKEILWNMATAILGVEDLKKLKEQNLIKCKGGQTIDLRLEEAFTEDVNVESLAKNIIELGKLSGQEIISILPIDSKFDSDLEFEPKKVGGDGEVLGRVFNYIKNVFQGYAFEVRDVEFITCVFVPVTLTSGFNDGPLVEVFKPYTDYLDKYVMPELEEAVVNHPKYGLMEK